MVMFIRRYRQDDCKEIIRLFYDTVHSINAKDYTKEQLDAWAPDKAETEKWNLSLLEHYSLVPSFAGAVYAMSQMTVTAFVAVGVIILAKNVMEFAQAYQQQDSSNMNSALKGILAGAMMAGRLP